MNFPSSPTVGQTYTLGSKTWVWNGSAWDLQSASPNNLTLDYLQLNTGATVTDAVGRIRWDANQGTADLGLLGGNIVQRLGQTLVAYVTNAEAVTITKGQAVYLFSATGDRASVKLAYNTGDATSAKTLGLVAEDIAAGASGFVMCQGVAYKMNTAAYTAGDSLYLGATAGSLTTTKPYAPNHLVYIGTVEKANAGNGQIYVRVQNGYELDEIHNVSAQSPSNGNTLVYNTSNSLWESTSTLPGSYTLSGGTAYGVTYLNGSKVLTSGSALTFDGANLGVGTGSPASKLQVVGGARLGSASGSAFSGALTTSGLDVMVGSGAGSAGAFQVWDDNSLSVPRFAITRDGNVGLGLVPTAWASPFKAFDFSTTASLVGSAGGANLFNNAYYNGSDYIYKTSAGATRYLQGSGEHYWYNAASGTAGNAITFTQVMGISATGVISDQNGNLRAIPQSGSAKTGSYTLATTDVGEFIHVGSGGSIVVPDATFATGDVVSIFNNTSGGITMTMSITTAYIGGTDADKATMTLATRGVATVLFISGTVCVVNGNVS